MSEERLSKIEEKVNEHTSAINQLMYITQKLDDALEKWSIKFDELAKKIEVFSGLVGSQVTLQQHINALDARVTKNEEQLIRFEEQKSNLEAMLKQHATDSSDKHKEASEWMDRAKYVVGGFAALITALQIWSLLK